MHMIRRHDKTAESISLVIEMPQHILDNRTASGNFENARTVPLVKPMMNTDRKQFVVLGESIVAARVRMAPQPFFPFAPPLIQLSLRKGIGQPERDEIYDPFLAPMREIRPGDVDRRGGIEKQRRSRQLKPVWRVVQIVEGHSCSI